MVSEDQLRDLRLLELPNQWPHYPICPVKHRTRKQKGNNLPMLGVVYADIPTVHVDVIMWGKDLAERMKAAEKEEFSSWEELVEAGWMGD